MRVLALFAMLSCAAAAQDSPPDLQQLMDSANAKYTRGEYADSLDVYFKALQLVEQTPADNPQRYDVLKRLVAVCSASGNFALANNYLKQAITWRETVFGPDDPKILPDLIQSSNLFRSMTNFTEARTTLRRVLTAHMKDPGFESLAVADDYSRLALISMDEKHIDPAVEELETALALRSRIAGQLDLSVVPDLDRLAPLYNAQNDYAKAELAFRRALVIRESLLGADNADLIASVDGLAYAYFGQHKYDLADATYKRLIGLWVKSLGAVHPMVAIAMDKVAIFYSAQKKIPEADAAFARASAIRANFFANGLLQEAAQQILMGNAAAVIPLYERALKALEPVQPMNEELHRQVAAYIKESRETTAPREPSKKTAPKK